VNVHASKEIKWSWVTHRGAAERRNEWEVNKHLTVLQEEKQKQAKG
jgi:hypothetical protein